MDDVRLAFVATLRGIASMRKHPMDDSQFAIWIGVLKQANIPLERATAELYNHVAESQFMPQPSDIIGRVNGTAQSKQLEAVEAWALVDDAVRHAGPYRDVVFQDAAIHTAIGMLGGWDVLNNCESDQELRFLGKDFEKCYAIALKKTGHPNILRGSQPGDRAPYLAGDRDKCLAVLRALPESTGRALPPINIKSLDGSNG